MSQEPGGSGKESRLLFAGLMTALLVIVRILSGPGTDPEREAVVPYAAWSAEMARQDEVRQALFAEFHDNDSARGRTQAEFERLGGSVPTTVQSLADAETRLDALEAWACALEAQRETQSRLRSLLAELVRLERTAPPWERLRAEMSREAVALYVRVADTANATEAVRAHRARLERVCKRLEPAHG